MRDWDDDRFIAFDFETSGQLPEYALQPWRVEQGLAWATSLVWCQKEPAEMRIEGGLAPTVDTMRAMLEHAITEKRTICGWNTVFDIQWLLAYGLEDLVFRAKWLDGMLLWRHWFIEPEYDMDRGKKKSYRLKTCVAEVLPRFAGYEEDVDFHSTDPGDLEKLHAYNVRDTMFTLRLTRHWYRKLAQEPQRLKAALIEAECLPLVAKANLDGMVVDTLAANELSAKLDNDAAKALEILAPFGVTEKVVRSPTQLANLMFDDWKLPVLKENTGKKTGKVSRATDKEVLHELAFIDERAKTLREYREALNNKTKFATAPLDSVEYNGDGRTRPQAIIFGTYSGRLTYASKQGANKDERQTGFALHQEKRDAIFRSIIQPPEGYTLMEFDASGQEFRWMAIASGDEAMLQLCLPGEDPHSYMGAQIRNMNYKDVVTLVSAEDSNAKAARQLGKVANLSCIEKDQPVLTDRGYICIQDVKKSDRVWDGVEWVSHDGVVYRGKRETFEYCGIRATADHKVLVAGRWVEFAEAAKHGWHIQPALEQGGEGDSGTAVRLLDGFVGGSVSALRRALCHGAVPLRDYKGGQPPVHGDRQEQVLQELRDNPTAPRERPLDRRYAGGKAPSEARQCHAAEMSELERRELQELRGAWDRVQVFLGEGGRGVHTLESACEDLRRLGLGPDRREWSLRAGELATGDAQGKRGEQETYDILNAGPRSRFVVGSVVVSNCQYRTSAPKLRTVARVQYNLPMELPEAQMIHKTYQMTYRQVPLYWQKQISMTKRLGYVETFAGRRVQVVGNWAGASAWSMGSTAINYRIQGTGADQKYLALSVLRPYLRRIGAYFGWDLHDGIYMYVPDAQVARAAEEIPRILANLPYEKAWGFSPPIPLPWDCKIGGSWGALKEYKGK